MRRVHVQEPIEVVLDRVGVERRAVVKRYALAKVEGVFGPVVRDVPGLRELPLQLGRCLRARQVDLDEAFVNLVVDEFCKPTAGDMRVENAMPRGHAPDQCAPGVGLFRARGAADREAEGEAAGKQGLLDREFSH